jgi:cytoskeleton protein RodZ
MSSVGASLRELRVRQGVSLEEVSRATRINPRYLEALEADNLGALPPPAFTRGFIRAYCQVLQSSADDALLLYHQQTGTPAPVAGPQSGEQRLDLQSRGRGPVLVSFVLVVVLGIALVGLTMLLQSGRETGGAVPVRQAVEPSPAPEPAEETEGSRPPAPAAAVTEARPSQPAAAPQPSAAVASPDKVSPDKATPAAATAASYRLIARVSEPTWIRVRMDDGRATEETIPAGEVREWVSKTPFVLTVGNAGGVLLELNGRPLPPLGARGAVISRLVVPSPQQ